MYRYKKNYGFRMSVWVLMIYAFLGFLICAIIGFVSIGVSQILYGGSGSAGVVSMHVIQWSQTLFVMIGAPLLWYRFMAERDQNGRKPSLMDILDEIGLTVVNWKQFMLTACLMVVSLPFMDAVESWCLSYLIPDFLSDYVERELADSVLLLGGMLQPSGFFGWVELLLLMCVGTAIGEEIMFRGALLSCFRNRCKYHRHMTAIVVGLIFSAIHMELSGLMPRWILGTLFVYLLYWSHSLWIPILAHFLNNLTALILYKITPPEELLSSSREPSFGWILILASLVVTVVLLKAIWDQRVPEDAEKSQDCTEIS